jgi:hypothetical protein
MQRHRIGPWHTGEVRIFAAVVSFALVAGACGGSETSGLLPTIVITRLDADGPTAILEFTVEDDSGPVTVAIDWGDESEPETFLVSGESAATHDYPPGVTDVVVTLVATDEDEQEVRAGRVLTLSPPSTTTGPTTTITSTTSTTTSSSTTTTSSATTSSPPTTSTATTTTTLPPEALEQVYELRLQDADFVDELISPPGAEGTAAPSGGEIDLEAETGGFDGGIVAQSRIQWLIPEEAWALLGPEPRLSVIMDYEYTVVLSTGPNPGRAAGFDFVIVGANAAQPNLGEGSGAVVTIGAGDVANQSDVDRTGFGTPLPANASGPIRITLVATCSVSPGTTPFQIGETSTCRADLRPTIRVTLTRNEGA